MQPIPNNDSYKLYIMSKLMLQICLFCTKKRYKELINSSNKCFYNAELNILYILFFNKLYIMDIASK